MTIVVPCLKYLSKTLRKINVISLTRRESTMGKDYNILAPPDSVRGITVLDRDCFSKQIKVPCLNLESTKLNTVVKPLKKYLLKIVNLKPIQDGTVNGQRKALLNPMLVQKWLDLDEELRKLCESLDMNESNLVFDNICLTYDNWPGDVVLKAVLPRDQEGLTSYSIVGHIVHVNIREHLLPFKKVIGEVLLDKVKQARTVVNKTDAVNTTYRNFIMELLCGEDDMLATVKENYCVYEFDFSSVYWNPRLSTEHERIVSLLEPGDLLLDVFAGVGPFSIPAARKKCVVYANDLNPESFKWLNHNIKLNKVKPGFITTFNRDGKEFILEDVKKVLLDTWQQGRKGKIHITMNLPALGLDFVKHFKHLLSREEVKGFSEEELKMPVVHVYFFVKGSDTKQLALQLFSEVTGLNEKDNLEVYFVRNVSVNKDMMRVTFPVPQHHLITEEPPSKKCCHSVGSVSV